MADRILVVATGEKWVGYGTRSFSSVMNEVMTHARKEISMTAYVISDLNITQNIKSALDRGVSAEYSFPLPTVWQRAGLSGRYSG